jgi:hypothetical protein
MEEITDIVETVNSGVNYRKGLAIAAIFVIGALTCKGIVGVVKREKAVDEDIQTTEAS